MRTVRRGIGLPEEYEIGIYWRVGARAKGRCGNHLPEVEKHGIGSQELRNDLEDVTKRR